MQVTLLVTFSAKELVDALHDMIVSTTGCHEQHDTVRAIPGSRACDHPAACVLACALRPQLARTMARLEPVSPARLPHAAAVQDGFLASRRSARCLASIMAYFDALWASIFELMMESAPRALGGAADRRQRPRHRRAVAAHRKAAQAALGGTA